MAKTKRHPTRLRKVACEDCGYTIRMARSWMDRGFPVCPCGQAMRPTDAGDLAYCGLIGPGDMSQAAWNAICRAEGWDIIRNQGQAARRLTANAIGRAGAAHCAHPGCNLWVAKDAAHCASGHAQGDDGDAAAAIPF
jgi:hypothetical protein